MKQAYRQLKNKILYNKEMIYIVSLGIFLISTILSSNTQIGEKRIVLATSLARYFSLTIISIKILVCDIKDYDRKTWIKIIILGILTIAVGKISDSRLLFQYLILIIGSYEIDFNKIAKNALIIELSTVIVIILLAVINVIPNRVFGRNNQEVARYALGFKYSTYPAIYMWYFTTLYLYLKNGKTRWWQYVILLIINTFFYILTDSRTELICSLMIIIIDFLYYKCNRKWIKNILIFLSKYSMVVFTILCLILAIGYNSKVPNMMKLNKILSGRLELAQRGLKNFGITMFGNKIEWIGLSLIYSGEKVSKDFNFVDISYLNILYNYGLITLSVILYSFFAITKKQIKRGNIYFCCTMLIIAIHGIINPQLFQITYNIFILLFVELIISGKKEEKNEKM